MGLPLSNGSYITECANLQLEGFLNASVQCGNVAALKVSSFEALNDKWREPWQRGEK